MSGAVAPPPIARRELGAWDCGRSGPTLLVIAGMHGNEPAGVLAARRILANLQELEVPLRGRMIALGGNLEALRRGQRFVDRDLNRGWSAEAVGSLGKGRLVSAEDREQRELLANFERILATASGPVVVLDMHTSSAGGAPFLCLADTIDNRRVGLATGIPLILGIEETIDGAALEWFADRGVVGLAVEGGQHRDPGTVDRLESALWRTLEFLGMLPAELGVADHRERLRKACSGVPPVVEIVHRHVISPEDGFRMEPGFHNFQAVEKGTKLATDRNGEILAPRDCLLMLPLYQDQGDDGFFLARRVPRFWLRVACLLRWLRLGHCITWLPGVRRDPGDRRTILVDPRIARWCVTEFFHLLGFRKQRRRGGKLAFTRRWSRPENARLGR